MTTRKKSTAVAMSQTNKAIVEAEKRERQTKLAKKAHQLRTEGASWFEIAEELKITENVASSLVADRVRAAAALVDEGAKRQILSLELERLDALQRSIWSTAITGDARAIDTALKIMAARAKLLGLDEAINANQVTNNTIVVPGNPVEYVAALRAMSGGNA